METASHTTATSTATTSTIVETTTERMVVETKHLLRRRHTREWGHKHIRVKRGVHEGSWSIHIIIIVETKTGKSIIHERRTSHIHPVHIRWNKHIGISRHPHVVIFTTVEVIWFSHGRFSFIVIVIFCSGDLG